MRLRSAAVVVCLLLVLPLLEPEIAQARIPNRTPRRSLEGEVAQNLTATPARGAVAGILVSRGGTPFVSLNADRPFTPASLAKIATTTATLLTLGPEFQFETKVVGPKIRNGVVAGNVTLVGGGDPVFSSSAYGAKRYLPAPNDPAPVKVFTHPFATVEGLAASVIQAGLRRVQGDLLVDDTIFDAARTQPGWLPTYQAPSSVEVGNIAGLTVDEGLGDLQGISVAPDPAMRAGALLKAALAARGVAISGAVRRGKASGSKIAGVLSPPVKEIVFYTNRWSVNYSAEMLLKNMGAYKGRSGSTAGGLVVLRAALEKAGIGLDGFSLTDGSGLSVQDAITPRTLAALLQHALDDSTEVGSAMRASLPVAGGPGTLLRRLRLAPAAGNLRGKTGLLAHVRGMAGWVRGLDGTTMVYVTLFNDAASPRALTGPIDAIGYALARFPYS